MLLSNAQVVSLFSIFFVLIDFENGLYSLWNSKISKICVGTYEISFVYSCYSFTKHPLLGIELKGRLLSNVIRTMDFMTICSQFSMENRREIYDTKYTYSIKYTGCLHYSNYLPFYIDTLHLRL